MPGGKKEEELGVLFPSTYVGSTSAKKMYSTLWYGTHTSAFPTKAIFHASHAKKIQGGGVGFCGKREIVSRFLWAFLFHFEGGEKNLDLTDMRSLVLEFGKRKDFTA